MSQKSPLFLEPLRADLLDGRSALIARRRRNGRIGVLAATCCALVVAGVGLLAAGRDNPDPGQIATDPTVSPPNSEPTATSTAAPTAVPTTPAPATVDPPSLASDFELLSPSRPAPGSTIELRVDATVTATYTISSWTGVTWERLYFIDAELDAAVPADEIYVEQDVSRDVAIETITIPADVPPGYVRLCASTVPQLCLDFLLS